MANGDLRAERNGTHEAMVVGQAGGFAGIFYAVWLERGCRRQGRKCSVGPAGRRGLPTGDP